MDFFWYPKHSDSSPAVLSLKCDQFFDLTGLHNARKDKMLRQGKKKS